MSGANRCRVCGHGNTTEFLHIPRAPVFCNQICRTREDAVAAPMAELLLAFCSECGHIFNAAYDPGRVRYSPEYENSLHFSGRFQSYVADLVADLTSRYQLSGKTVMEIGCGSGDFLRALCQAGGSRGFGFDPSYPGDPDDADGAAPVIIRRAPYGESTTAIEPDLVCCRHCLEHIGEPSEFLRELHQHICRREARLFFEVPNALYTLRDEGIWDLIYEHCGYFSPSSFHHAFVGAGFEVTDVEETFGGQFLNLYAKCGGSADPAFLPPPTGTAMAPWVHSFADRYQEKVGLWRRRLAEQQARRRKVVIWGIGSKGTTFLNALQPTDLPYVVDINPRKQGCFVAGTGQEIVSPQTLGEWRPDVVIVMNPIYREEIRNTLGGMGLTPELLEA